MGNTNGTFNDTFNSTSDTIKIDIDNPLYISLTTTPPRLRKTIDIIDRLSKSIKVKSSYFKIILNICKNYKRWPNHKIDLITKHRLQQLDSSNDNIIVNYTDDIGPITKLIPSLDITPDECIILVIDDDCYHTEAIKIASEYQNKQKDKSFTYWKYNFKGIEIPQGVDIITFWKPNLRNFKKFYNYSKNCEYCFHVDDLIIGKFLDVNDIQLIQLNRKWKYPWIPNCNNRGEGLYSLKGKYNRTNAMEKCFRMINK